MADTDAMRKDFEQWKQENGVVGGGTLLDRIYFAGWQQGQSRALASRPAEVDDECLPALPKAFGRFNVNGPDEHRIKGYTAEQFRQGQRDAVAADRALLRECKRFLEDMHSMPVEWTIKESQVLHEKLSAPSHTTNKEKGGADGHVLDR